MCNQRMSSQNKWSFDKIVNHDLSLYVIFCWCWCQSVLSELGQTTLTSVLSEGGCQRLLLIHENTS